jgi:hypothetical protein
MFTKTHRLLFLGLCLITTSAIAETELRSKPVQCGPKASLLQLIEEAGEEALVGGVADVIVEGGQKMQVAVTFFANPIEGTWTMVEFHTPLEACVVAYGGSLVFDVQQYFDKKEAL